MTSARVRCLVVAASLALVLGCVAEVGGAVVAGPGEVVRRTPEPPGRAALRDWDAARAAAWRSGDGDRLARLYVGRSRAGRRDVAMLARWNERGARVDDLSTQVLAVEPERVGAHRVVLRVTDRLHVVRAGAGVLTGDRPTTRRVELVRRDGRWLVARVWPVRP